MPHTCFEWENNTLTEEKRREKKTNKPDKTESMRKNDPATSYGISPQHRKKDGIRIYFGYIYRIQIYPNNSVFCARKFGDKIFYFYQIGTSIKVEANEE